jgi:hypothetical protein
MDQCGADDAKRSMVRGTHLVASMNTLPVPLADHLLQGDRQRPPQARRLPVSLARGTVTPSGGEEATMA